MIFITMLKNSLLFISQIRCILQLLTSVCIFFDINEILNMTFFMLLELQ
jgi:hypothetical protein